MVRALFGFGGLFCLYCKSPAKTKSLENTKEHGF